MAFSYDTVAYPGHAYDYTHPGRLATMAALYGMQPASLDNCRVLELGCGSGGNLIPFAYQWPQAECLGVDLSATAIAQGGDIIAALALDNVTLRHCDILDLGGEIGRFDYIIAHGVYSWVPEPVREKMLTLIAAQLAPQGVAYLSYNSHPGSHLRDLSRDIMRYHVAAIADPRERIAQARAILAVMAELSDAGSVHGAVLRDQHERVRRMSDAVLFHDDLSAVSVAFTLSEVVAAAERYGLQYLSDADLARSDLQRLPPAAARLLAQFPADDLVVREQYQDFIEGHSFRRTLLCRGDVALARDLGPDVVCRFHLAAEAVPRDGPIDPAATGIASFRIGREAGLSTDHGLSKAAILHLGEVWPQAVGFSDLLAAALERLGAAAAAVRAQGAEEVAKLVDILFRASRGGQVTLHLFPPRLTTAVSARPRASRLARMQATQGTLVTNLAHGTVLLEDPIVRRFLCLVDGTRTAAELAVALAESVQRNQAMATFAGDAGVPLPVIDQAAVERNLALLARLGLLEA